MLLSTPGQRYHAHYTVGIASPLILSARATLVVFLNLVVFLLVWGAGRFMAGGLRRPFRGWRVLVTSFRARLTVALFGFFLISIAIFGTLAFRGLTTATVRAAEVLAERATDDAATSYNESGGGMELLARRVRSELLEYRNGALREGSVEELVSLGLYDGWVPLEVHQLLSRREALQTLGSGALGEWAYITSFRRLPDGDILAAPVSLQAGAIAVRRREVLDLLGFAALVGAALSLGLAFLVGRTLARPILTLQVASERVGGGNLRLRLPEDRVDEFGSVFVAFNRMVERLRKARRELVRTTSRTQAIVDEAATGVVALDAAGRITLVNPRAEALLDRTITVGEHLLETGGSADALVAWVDRYFRDGVRESATDLQLDDRRIRVQARRISRRGPLGGAVLSLEDVTDELRTERILAWGEMAQQVAHEVKNPLTPIKLSVQHIRRAWTDRRSDYGDILARNVEAILAEIDRLASIASSFSRFGAPRAAGEAPLEGIAVEDVVVQTLALYEAGEGVITFQAEIAPGLPLVTARESELKEVLINLLENARAAIGDEGVVRVQATTEESGVELRVVDNGSGIEADLLPRLFEPHFSTRSTGTGLGLAIVRRLVESWMGTVEMESRPGDGTTVRMHLVPWGG
jgi:signal transduction histidine kinase